MDEELEKMVVYLSAMRAYYAAENKIGLLLDELISDCRNNAPREEIMADAAAIEEEHPGSTVAAAIAKVKRLLGA